MAFVNIAPLAHKATTVVRGVRAVSPKRSVSSTSRDRVRVTMANKSQFNPNKMPTQSEKQKLEPEQVLLEVKPSLTEVLLPFISILTVVGIIPFIASLARQLWVRYKITSRRISIQSGFLGNDTVEVVYRDVKQIRYVRRLLGASADMVISLKDGAKLELRAVPQFDKILPYIMDRIDDDAREASGYAGRQPST